MKGLHHKVNIVPIIAKADALTADELSQMKKTVDKKNNEVIRSVEMFDL
jgi:septin family protein